MTLILKDGGSPEGFDTDDELQPSPPANAGF
jgi:hypothetical protein